MMTFVYLGVSLFRTLMIMLLNQFLEVEMFPVVSLFVTLENIRRQ